jgi:radical SAM superfamily enzyme YgiQ (UPF0313 family)
MVNMDNTPNLVEQVRYCSPDLLGFSATTGIHQKYLQASQEIRKALNVLSVFGGPHPSFFPELIEEDGVDVICQGEGEYPLLELVEALENGRDFHNILNLWMKTNGQIYHNPTRPYLQDLDSLPFPDRELMQELPAPMAKGERFFIAGRGCPYNCSFCFNHVASRLSKGKYVRWRSVDNVIQEIKEVKDRYDLRLVNFQDDTFVLRMDWLEEFAGKYKKEIGLPFFCHVRADLVNDGMSRLLADAGCVHVAIGLESGNDYLRNQILRKHFSKEQIVSACHSLRAHNIRVTTQNMFGVPHETVDTVLETIELNIQCRPHRAYLYFFTPYPKTDLAEYAFRHGCCRADRFDHMPYSFAVEQASVALDLPEKENIEHLARLAGLCIRLPSLLPVIRFIFKLRGAGWLKALAARSLLALQSRFVSVRHHLFSLVHRDPS